MADIPEGNGEAKCPHCGRRMFGKITFNANLARVFVLAAQRARHQTVRYRWPKVPGNKEWREVSVPNTVTCEDFKRDRLSVEYTIMAKLKYFGLIEQSEEWSRQGIYTLTQASFDFLRGKKEVPTFVMVSRGEVLARSAIGISLRQALGGEWFDISDWILDWCEKHPDESSPKQTELF